MKDPEEPTWSPVVHAMLDLHRPDVVISWTVNAPLQRECRERKILVMHQELGPLRAPLVPLFYADPRGVNGASSIQALWPDLERTPWTQREEAQLDRWVSMAYPLSSTRAEHRHELGLDPHRRTIAVFGQMNRDSNVLAWSRVGGSSGMLNALAAATDRTGFQLVVKHHPYEAPAPVPAGVIVAPHTMTAASLIAASDAVATINSSVGIEALLQAKPLYLFGEGPLSGVGASRDVDGEPNALSERLRLDPAGLAPAEDLARKRLLRFLLLRYFRSDNSLTDADSLLTILTTWKDLTQRGAPLLDFFPEENVAVRLREDTATLELEEMSRTVERAKKTSTEHQQELATLQVALAERTSELAAQRVELAAVQAEFIAQQVELSAQRAAVSAVEAQRAQESATQTAQLKEQADRLAQESQRLEQVRQALASLEFSRGVRLVRSMKRLLGARTVELASQNRVVARLFDTFAPPKI